MTIKKAFQPIVNLLESNKDSTVGDILSQVIEIASAKTRSATADLVHRNDKGEVIAIFDYYFKAWMPLSHVEFGAKASSATGYSNMSKEGTSNWTKQNREFKKGKDDILEKLMSNEIDVEEAQKLNEKLEIAKSTIVPHSAGIGFETIEELLECDESILDDLVAQAELEAEDEIEDGADEE